MRDDGVVATGAFLTQRDDTGRRRAYSLTLLADNGRYPFGTFDFRDALFVATPSLAYSVVRAEPPNEFDFSEIGWANVGEIRLWGALAFALREREGHFSFVPFAQQALWMEVVTERKVRGIAERLARNQAPQNHQPYRNVQVEDVATLHAALRVADNVLLRGVACFLKAQILRNYILLTEEMAINLHISLEAGLLSLRRLLGRGRAVSLDVAYQFIEQNFTHGNSLVEFWIDRRFDRNVLLHPVSDLGSHVVPPMCVDDVWELVHPMMSLYRFLLTGAMRPEFDQRGRPVEGTGR